MTRNRYSWVATIIAGATCSVTLAASGALAAPTAEPRLVLNCTGATLVATVRGDTRSFRKATFEFGAKRIVDRTKPFSVRIASAKVTSTVAAVAFVYPNGQPFEVEVAVPPRCVGGQ